MRLLSYIIFKYKNLSYQKKLLFSYFTLIFVPLIILSIYFGVYTSRSLREHSINLCHLHLNQATNALYTKTSDMLSLAKSISMQKLIRTDLEKDPASLTLMQQADDLTEISEQVSSLYYDTSIYSVRLFVNSKFAYARRRIVTWPLSEAEALFCDEAEYIMRTPTLHGPTLLSTDAHTLRPVFSLTMPIHATEDYNRTTALACVDIFQDAVLEIMKTADYSQKGNVYLTDSRGTPLLGYSNSKNSLIAADELPASIDISKTLVLEDNGNMTAVSSQIEGYWYLVTCSPVYSLSSQDRFFTLQLALFSLTIGIAVYLLAYVYARFNTRRIVSLSNTVAKIQQGELDVHCTVDSYDEIGDLQNSFNEMVLQINHLLDSQYQLGKQIKDSELKLLQAQINPHFLYNTLNLIKWTAQNKNADEVSDIVEKLSRYYRIGLSNGLELISIHDELEHVSLYVQLQNKRFDNNIQLEIHADAAVYEYRILKLLLQPLVENCILHGLKDNRGIITIDLAQSEAFLCITITDDGVGISAEKQARIRLNQELKITTSGQGGYGLTNIQERLLNFYGKESVLQISSAPGMGTSVKICLPLNKVIPK
ncbi:MAG: sensor histidine kinase [Lachnospiraceae bacterium]|nr:sensor histidine kinase [Lachnospiraceae bacterium]